jgi:hypothetical protein
MPGDVILMTNPDPLMQVPGTVLYAIDPDTGDRTVASSPGFSVNVCFAAGSPFECCTGPFTNNGQPPCTALGSGENVMDPRAVRWDADGSILVLGEFLMRVDPATGNRTVVSSPQLSSECSQAGIPYMCCTGSSTDNGQAPCAALGTGEEWFTAGSMVDMAIVSSIPPSVTSLPAWGIPLLAGILLGISMRAVGRSRAPSGDQVP